MKKGIWIWAFIVTSLCACGNNAVTSHSRMDYVGLKEIWPIRSIYFCDFICNDKLVAKAIKNTIIQELVGYDVSVIEDSTNADVIINGTITMSSDKVSGGGGAVTRIGASAYEGSSEGGYVAGITAQLRKGQKILWSATATQVRTNKWIPGPGEVMGRKIGKKMAMLFR